MSQFSKASIYRKVGVAEVKEAGFMVLAGLVGGICTRFLPPVFGHENQIIFVATVAALGGGAVGVLLKRLSMWRLIFVILGSVGISVIGLINYGEVVSGEPGGIAMNWIYLWTVVLFVPIGILIEIFGLKITHTME